MFGWKCESCGSRKKGSYKLVCNACYQRDYWRRCGKEIKERQKESHKKWVAKNKKHKSLYEKAWREKNPGMYHYSHARCHLRKLGRKELNRLLESFGYVRR